MSDIVAKARALLDGITPGTWRQSDRDFVFVEEADAIALNVPVDEMESTEFYGGPLIAESIHPRNRQFIAASPQLVRDLIAEIERLRART